MLSRRLSRCLRLCPILVWAAISNVFASSIETCNFETFSATCHPDEVMMVSSAEFGRMRVGRCITENEFIGCTNDVLSQVDARCSGKRQCAFPVFDLNVHNEKCSRSLVMYLTVHYSCMKVESQCSVGPNILRKDRGHLSNQISCGSPKPHWTIRAQVGQIINMSLIDFAVSDKVESFITCKYVYGYILERALGINHTICGGKNREGALYSSKTNSVELYLVGKNEIEKSFVISFEANGCPELKRPPNAWYKRQANKAVIGCETNDQEWRLTCTGNTWQGSVGNCSAQMQKPVSASSKEEQHGLDMSSVVLMTGFAGGALVVVVVVIVIGVVYLKKYRIRKETKHMEISYATMGRNTGIHEPGLLVPGINGPHQPTNQRPGPGDMPSYPTQWACATLPAGEGRTDPLIELSDAKESLYNSLK